MVGDGAFGLTVIGSGFVPGSTVLWNGEDRTTGFINEFMLAATIRASDTLAVGTAFVSVLNPAPGGGQSLVGARVHHRLSGADHAAARARLLCGRAAPPSRSRSPAAASRPSPWCSGRASIARRSTSRPSAWRRRSPPPRSRTQAPPPCACSRPAPGVGSAPRCPPTCAPTTWPPVTVVSGLKGMWHGATTKFTLVATDVGLGVEWTYYRLGTVRRPQGRPHGRRPRTQGPLERRHAHGGLLLRGQGGQSGSAQERAGGHRHAAAGHDRGRRQSGARRHAAAQVPHRRHHEPAGPRRPTDRQPPRPARWCCAATSGIRPRARGAPAAPAG